MPTGPRGEKRPADAIGRAVMIGKIATGEVEESIGASSAAVTLGKLGGQARARNLSPERRSEIAQKAAAARYSKQ